MSFRNPFPGCLCQVLFQNLLLCFHLFRGSIEGVLFNPLKLKTLKRVQGDKKENSITLRLPRLQEAQPRSGTTIRHCAILSLLLASEDAEASDVAIPSFVMLNLFQHLIFVFPSSCHSEFVSESHLFVLKKE